MSTKSSTAIDRVAVSLPEARLEHGLSQRRLAELSGVGRHTIARVERGDRVDPALLVRLGATLLVLDAYRPPLDEPAVELDPRRLGGWSARELMTRVREAVAA